MSDFLTRLAARELRTVPVLEPRIRALFEPEPGHLSSAGPATPQLLADDRVPEWRGKRRISDSPGRSRIDQVATPDSEILRESFHPHEQLSKPQMQLPSQAPDARPRESRRTPVDGGSRQVDTGEAAQLPSPRREKHADRVTAAPDVVFGTASNPDVDRGIARPLENESAARLLPRRERSDPDRSRAPELLNATHTQRNRAIPRRLVEDSVDAADEGSTVLRARAATRPLESLRPSPSPIPPAIEAPIHVTIGRIEVTTVTSAARTKEKVKARSRMSLDDYLSARRRGSR